jgi:hypothetical protein
MEDVEWIHVAQDRDRKQALRTFECDKKRGISLVAERLLASEEDFAPWS